MDARREGELKTIMSTRHLAAVLGSIALAAAQCDDACRRGLAVALCRELAAITDPDGPRAEPSGDNTPQATLVLPTVLRPMLEPRASALHDLSSC